MSQYLLNTTAINHSPIKRIPMHTSAPSTASRVKMVVFMLFTLVCIVCFSKNSFSQIQRKNDSTVVYRGNTIEFSRSKKPDVQSYKNQLTGKKHRDATDWPVPPIKLNKVRIYNPEKDQDIIKPMMKGAYKSIAAYLLQNAAKEFETLEDGNYLIIIENVVIDPKGKVAYFENKGVFQDLGDINKQQPKQKEITDKKLHDLMDNAPVSYPAMINDNPVPFLIEELFPYYFGYSSGIDFTVKEHKVIKDRTIIE